MTLGEGQVTIGHGRLVELMTACFAGVGLSPGDASAVATVLADANLHGIDSHGVERAPIYMSRVTRGLARGTDAVTTLLDAGPICRIDAGHALGPAVSTQATDRAIEMARVHGMGLVTVGRSTHFGAAGFYARRAAAAGMAALVASNAPATMAPHGGAERFLGANPLAIGLPVGRHGEFVLDMSTSVIARGRIRRAEALGESLPPGVALDTDGNPTLDAAAALAGCVLPVGGPKGSGLAMAISLLVGFLAGADFDDEMESMYSGFDRPHNIGHLFWVVDPSGFADQRTATLRAESLIDRLHAIGPAYAGGDVMFAGERQSAVARGRLAEGIPIAAGELRRLADAARDCHRPDIAGLIDELVAAPAEPVS